MFDWRHLVCWVVAVLGLAGGAWAGEAAERPEDTMMVIEEGTEPRDIVGVIELPRPPPEQAPPGGDPATREGEPGAFGRETAEEARAGAGRAAGERASEAAEAAREVRQSAARQAEAARESAAEVAEEARRNASENADAMREAAEEIRDKARRRDRPEERPDPGNGPP